MKLIQHSLFSAICLLFYVRRKKYFSLKAHIEREREERGLLQLVNGHLINELYNFGKLFNVSSVFKQVKIFKFKLFNCEEELTFYMLNK